MRLILKDYIETLKEEKELESLLEKILIMNDFTDIIRPQKGISQHGVDFSAQKDNTLYLFALKQKDIDKNNWNTGNNAVRPTLDEVIDSYIPQRLNNYTGKINIILCTNGIIKQNIKPDWEGYIYRNQTDNRTYDFWGIDELVLRTEGFLLSEYLFADELKSDLRKTLYFFEDDINLSYYNELLEKLILKIDIDIRNTKPKVYNKSNITYMLILKMCLSYATLKNSKIALIMSEKALLKYWNFIIQNELYEEVIEMEFLLNICKEYENCCRKYMVEIKTIYEYSPSLPIYNSLEYRIALYEMIGIIASYTYYLQHYYGDTDEVKENINILITLVNNNVAFYYPIYDLNIIEINILLYLLKTVEIGQCSHLLEGILSKIGSRMNVSKYYPTEYEDYEKALDMEFDNEVEEMKASLLITNLLEWMLIFDKNDTIEGFSQFIYRKFSNITFNTIQIDKEYENNYFRGIMEDTLVTYYLDYTKPLEVIDDIKRINEKYKLDDYNFFKYNAIPFLFISARNNRLPLPSIIWYKWITNLNT